MVRSGSEDTCAKGKEGKETEGGGEGVSREGQLQGFRGDTLSRQCTHLVPVYPHGLATGAPLPQLEYI